mgnify:CR=1 FL=1
MNAIKKLLGSPKKIMKKIIAGIVITAGAIFGVNHLHQGGVGHSNRENLAGVMAEGTKLETVDGKYVGGGNSNRENLAGATSEELLAPKPNRENLAGITPQEMLKKEPSLSSLIESGSTSKMHTDQNSESYKNIREIYQQMQSQNLRYQDPSIGINLTKE